MKILSIGSLYDLLRYKTHAVFLEYSNILRRHDTVLAAVENYGIRLGRMGCLGQATFVHEHLEVLLRVPVPGGVGGKEKIHLLQGALVGLGVESPNHRQGYCVGDTEDVEGLLSDGLEHDGA